MTACIYADPSPPHYTRGVPNTAVGPSTGPKAAIGAACSSAKLTFASLLPLFFPPLLVERVELGQPLQRVSASTLTKPTPDSKQ